LTCIVCKAQFDFDDARVIRELIDPKANQNHETPRLCWVCAHLHHAAHQQEVIPAFT
jgi:hypothetical protein